ncbi:MAG: sugar phosphate isomerase/epimerase [Clostridia bacterium]|nr:sugar phosphate isomerase/epimerase [Clostridia bacterium]
MKYGTLVRIPPEGDLKEESTKRFRRLAELGLDSCQLSYKPAEYRVEDAAVIAAAAKENGIEISAQFLGNRDDLCFWDNYYDYRLAGVNSLLFGGERIRYLLSAIPFVQALGITDVIIHAGFIPADPFSEKYADMLSVVRLLGTRLKAAGLNLLFETGQESPVILLRLIEDAGLDNLYINLDTANILMYGYGNPVDAVYTFGKYVRNMHAKDGFPPTGGRIMGKEAEIGEGFVDFRKVFSMLKALGYDRYVTIEREISGGQQEEQIMKALDRLKKIVEEV